MEREQIILIDKPKGITSFDVIRRLRRTLGVRKMGHAGTLDPHATGLMIVGIGEGTKRLQEYMGLPKTYIMDVLLGIKTDTGDITGTLLEELPAGIRPLIQGSDPCIATDADRKKVLAVLKEMTGTIELPIPAYSALKYRGKPRYHYARKGIAIEEKKREMEIYSLILLDIAGTPERPLLKIEMDCASGTYARSVAEEIGRRLGVPATLQDLRRTRIGTFSVADARPLD